MCYYNGTKVTHATFIRLKTIEKAVAQYDFLSKPLHIGFDYGKVPVLQRVPGKEDFDIVEKEWGFLPSYIKTREQAHKFRNGYKKENGQWQKPFLTLNAKSEEMLFKDKIYRDAALNRRCLFISTEFYEWRHVYPIGKRTGKPLKTAVKYPYHISIKDEEYFYIAGIYNPWTDYLTGETIDTCALITTEANKYMAKIHNSEKRMATVLTQELAWKWLLGDLNEAMISEIGRFQYAAEEMEAYTVARDFRTALDPTIPFHYEELEQLRA